MARIRPFRAWRYNEAVITDIQLKFSPLFDVVSPEQLQALYSIPNNSIHLSVPRSHEEAVAKLHAWKDRGILRQDSLPGIYVYYQQFSLFGESRQFTRKGFICMIRVDEKSGQSGSDIVLHEDTISASVEERTRLLEQTMLNTAPTHGLYDDPGFTLETLMDIYMEQPLYEYTDYQGVWNKLAIIHDKRDINRFIQMIGERQIYLADGHHRLASSVALARKKAQEPGADSESMVNYHLMYLTNLRSDDLRILPIHRLVTLPAPIQDAEEFIRKFEKCFHVEEVTKHKSPLAEEIKEVKRSYGLILQNRQFILRLKAEINPIRDITIPLPDAVKELEYTQLHYFVLDQILGIPYTTQHGSNAIRYIKDSGSAVRAAMDDPSTIAFLMRETTMDDMMNVCLSGALMPQKSTFFYPKVVCGLVFSSIDENENNSSFDLSFREPPAAQPAE